MVTGAASSQNAGETTGQEALPVRGAPRRPQQPGALADGIIEAVKAGTPLLAIPQTDAISDGVAKQLAAAGAFTYNGAVGDLRAPWMGNWYFVRKHALYDGMPVDQAMGIHYQAKGQAANGLVIDRAPGGAEVEIIAAYSRDHSRVIGAGTFTTRFGAGKIVYQRVPELQPVMQQRFLANALRWLTGGVSRLGSHSSRYNRDEWGTRLIGAITQKRQPGGCLFVCCVFRLRLSVRGVRGGVVHRGRSRLGRLGQDHNAILHDDLNWVGGEGVVGPGEGDGLADGGGRGDCIRLGLGRILDCLVIGGQLGLVGGLLGGGCIGRRGRRLIDRLRRRHVEGEVGGLGIGLLGVVGDSDLQHGWRGGDDERAGYLDGLALDRIPNLRGVVRRAKLEDHLLVFGGKRGVDRM